MGHEVVLFQILSREEIELPYRRDLEFADLESGRTLAIDAGLARRGYRDAVAAFLERWHSRAGAEALSVLADRHQIRRLSARSAIPCSRGSAGPFRPAR